MVYTCKIAGFLHKKGSFLTKIPFVTKQIFYIKKQLFYKNIFCKKEAFLHKKAAFLQKYIGAWKAAGSFLLTNVCLGLIPEIFRLHRISLADSLLHSCF